MFYSFKSIFVRVEVPPNTEHPSDQIITGNYNHSRSIHKNKQAHKKIKKEKRNTKFMRFSLNIFINRREEQNK